jgi:hypothetical protein
MLTAPHLRASREDVGLSVLPILGVQEKFLDIGIQKAGTP